MWRCIEENALIIWGDILTAGQVCSWDNLSSRAAKSPNGAREAKGEINKRISDRYLLWKIMWQSLLLIDKMSTGFICSHQSGQSNQYRRMFSGVKTCSNEWHGTTKAILARPCATWIGSKVITSFSNLLYICSGKKCGIATITPLLIGKLSSGPHFICSHQSDQSIQYRLVFCG